MTVALTAAWATGLALTACPGLAAPALASSESGCPAVMGVFLPGTWETNTGADETRAVGLLAPVATTLAERYGGDFEFRFPAYAAAAFDGMAYGDSKDTGVAAARRVIGDAATRCPATKFVLAGYSQGADAMGDVAASAGCSGDPVSADRVLAVGLIADPRQGTAGGKLVGPQVDGQGIAGPRDSGFCALSAVTAEICATGDKYCATNATENPITAGIGQALTQAGVEHNDLASALTTDLSTADITELPTAVEQLGSTSGTELGSATKTVTDSLGSLAALGNWVEDNPSARARLDQAADGTAEKAAAGILDGLRESNIGAALDSLAQVGLRLAETHAADTAAATAAQAADSVTPLTDAVTSTESETIAQAAQVLAVLKPSVVFDQLMNVVDHGLEFAVDIPALVDALNRMLGVLGDPATDIPGKVRALHGVIGEVNTLFEPLVALADGVDLHTVSRLIAMIPDTTGTAQVASILVGLLANLDVKQLASQVGRLQENVWALAETIAAGGDLLAIGARLLEFAPTALGFATLAVQTLTGESTTSSDTTSTDIASAARTLVASAGGGQDGADAVGQLLSEGLEAVEFLLSGVHQDYGNYVVDSDGRTAVVWLTDWFSNRIRQVVVVR
ncbi:cutinase family protein [Nocardia uniformis]|uniref:cutinase family protein n=2 Tax=Nocardia uniformis TaxID=53432 RepID=UPI001471326D|nr:cutinase family protein [Nocardia uniformis]